MGIVGGLIPRLGMRHSSQNYSRRTGLRLAVGTVLLVVGWHLCVIARQRHLLAVATEVGSIAQSKEELINEELVPSGDGRGVVFFQETETGIGTYFCDTASGRSKLLFEQNENGYSGQFGMLAWSPDNRLFACAVLSDPNPLRPKREIILYHGDSGEVAAKVEAAGYLVESKLIWLSPHSFAYSTYNQAWLVFEEKTAGNWSQTQAIKRFADGELKNLAAISPHAMAWQQGDEVWSYDLATGVAEKLWGTATNKLNSFTYSAETGNLLLNCSDANGPLSICFRPPRLRDTPGTILDMTRGVTRTRSVDLRMEQGHYAFTITPATNSEPTHFVWDGMVEYYKLAGDFLYFTGNPPDAPPGIWQYNINTRTARCLASGLKGNFKYTSMVVPMGGIGKNAAGKEMSYHLWSPAQVVPGKKYPLILGQAHYMWFSYPQVAANGGYYFAAADRLSWWAGLADWGADVMGLYEILAKNPNIDTNRIYLFATSAESSLLSQFVAEKPDLWRGVILFNPVVEPDLSQAHLSTMFIVSGKDDDNNTLAGLSKYQAEAAKAGIPVKLIVQDGVQHITRSIATERERTKQFARFLLEN